MRVDPLGEEAYILRDLGSEPAHSLARRLTEAGIPGLLEATPSYETVGLYVEPDQFEIDRAISVASTRGKGAAVPQNRHEIPVCYDLGEDLREVCGLLDVDVDTFVALHSGTPFTCFAIGFAPGFPYLGNLPDALRGVHRLETPRPRVPRGSVGITGKQTGIYPDELPGGWRLVGRTPLRIVDLDSAYFPIAPGDVVTFRAIDAVEYRELEGSRL